MKLYSDLRCSICGELATHLWRCDEHYRCDTCGTTGYPEGYLISGSKRVECESCREKRIEEAKTKTHKTQYTSEIVCPHCGYKFTDSWEFISDGEIECRECDQPFFMERIVTVQYTTSKT